MRDVAKDAAARAFEGGMETYVDLRAVTAVWLEDRAGMREFDASALAKVIADSQHAPKKAQPAAQEDEQEDSSGEVNPEGGGSGKAEEVDPFKGGDQSGEETQSAGQTEVSTALTHASCFSPAGRAAGPDRGLGEDYSGQDGGFAQGGWPSAYSQGD